MRRNMRKRRKNHGSLSMLIGVSLLFGAVLGLVVPQPVWADASVDLGADVLECRVTQRGSSDCAVASMATVEAYMNDLKGDSQAAYDAIWNTNGQQAYIQSWANLGYRTYSLSSDFDGDVEAFCERIYEELEKGMPCLVRRNSSPTHYSVIVGYSGDGDRFELGDFTILEVNGGAPEEKALKNLEEWMQVTGGTELNQLVIRQGGIGEISDEGSEEEPNRGDERESKITIAGGTRPGSIHKKGASCLIKGTVSSKQVLSQVNAAVYKTSGEEILTKTAEPNTKTYELANMDRDIAVSRLGTGSYIYRVIATDSAGYTTTLVRSPFAVVEDITSTGNNSDFQKMDNLITLQIDNPTMYLNGEATPIDESGTAPIIRDDRTLLPLRVVMESMGAEVKWYGDDGMVTVSMGEKELNLQIDKTQAWDNDSETMYDLPSPPVIINDRTMLPIRFVVEYFGGTVEWSQSAQMAAIAYR